MTVSNASPPAVTLTVGGAARGYSQQLPVTIAIATAYPTTISGTATLKFTPDASITTAGVDDAMIQFSAGGRTASFTIPAGSTSTSVTVLTGTTAGTIAVTVDLKDPSGVDLGSTTTNIVNAPGVPFISKVTFAQTPGGITVTVTGFSSSREMVSGLFHFAPATNVSFASSDLTVPLASAFSTWYSNTAQSNPFGTQFTLTAPFSLSTQSTAVVSVTVTLTNSKGSSNAVTLSQ